jgi:hypothetical protein
MSYSVEFCEREYNNRLLVPEHAAIFKRWADEGKQFRNVHQNDPGTRLHCAYAKSEGSTLDYFSCGVPGRRSSSSFTADIGARSTSMIFPGLRGPCWQRTLMSQW